MRRAASLLVLAATALTASAQQPKPAPKLQPGTRPAKSAPVADDTAPAAQLPVTRVSLYKNGVGFFEHDGRVTGSQAVMIDFTTAQLNDVLQSLTAIDLGGGRIAGAEYNSTTPIEEQLKSLGLGLTEETTFSKLFTALHGALVEVSGSGSAFTGRIVDVEMHKTAGTAAPEAKAPTDMTEGRFLTVASEAGEIRVFEVTPSLSVRLLDASAHSDLNQYLRLLASTRNEALRHLTLEDNGTGTRELHVSYLSEVPIWKSTYRILFSEPKVSAASAAATATLQGWSVVDNTTGADWVNVQLSLIAGAPQSFIQPLSVPYYSRRPEIALPQEAQLTPQTHESGEQDKASGNAIQGIVTDKTGAVVPNATVTATNTDTGVQTTRTTDGTGAFSLAPLQPGNYNVEVVARGFQRLLQENVRVNVSSNPRVRLELTVGGQNSTVTITDAPTFLDTVGGTLGGTIENNLYSQLPLAASMGVGRGNGIGRGMGAGVAGGIYSGTGSTNLNENYLEAAQASNAPNATTSAFDDYFAYDLTYPVTIRKNESALVPILQTKVDAERVTLWSAQQPTPLRALWITNTSNLTLDRGSFTIVEDGNFGGEGLLDPIHPAEKRLLSYAVDQAVHVSTESPSNSTHNTSITVSKGVLAIHHTQIVEIVYVVHNAAPEARTVIVEHPIHRGYELDNASGQNGQDPKPVETTPTLYRYRVIAGPGETVRLHVGERLNNATTYRLTNANDSQFSFITTQAANNPAVMQALQPVLDARRHVADMQEAVDKVSVRLEGLRSDEERQRANVTALASADKASRERFVHDLNATEDQIAAAQKDLTVAEANLQAAKDDLAGKIEGLQMNETL